MSIIGLNILAVLAATIAGMLVGAAWYSPYLFGTQWMQCIGKTPASFAETKIPMFGAFFANIIMATGLAILFAVTGITGLLQAAEVGLIISCLIVFPAFLSDTLFCDTSIRLLFIQSGYRMLTITIMAIVVAHVAR